ncbi:ABC transporter permease [Herbivorax sp. ANBcel31]|uniref:ABC transporter permease n=1 Tax=Herbivorax sp. ANBcel31 TaxID=3069754 RepID=UPI0027AE461C|nr:ABC transporter permease [Herbivorax sp. ANBcel31]MDQ2087781.1 ABC transporter permease [Herbivorax sp. ANBcel31]
MFFHIFIYRLKCLLRDKQMIFWTLLFPLLLATFFRMAFGNLYAGEKFEPVSIAVVQNDAYEEDANFKYVLKSLSTGDERMFNLNETDVEEAKQKLSEGEITAYFVLNDDIEMFVRGTGIGQTIVKIFLEQYQQTLAVAEDIVREKPELANNIGEYLSTQNNYLREVPVSSANPNVVLNYFYALIAMTCMFGAFWGQKDVKDIQADQSDRAARTGVAPVHKLKRYLCGASASIIIHYIEILILIAYLYFALEVDFGERNSYVLFTALIGSIAGIAFGSFVSSVVKKSENIKEAILIAVTMTGSFLAGMMFDHVKYIVAKNLPVLAYINPVNLLTDAFYSLYYYDTFNRYWFNIGLLTAFIIVFSFGTYMVLRRQKYASI